MSEPTQPPGDGVLMIHCRHAAVLLSRRQDMPLSRTDAIKLRLHLALCRHCRNVARQFAAIGLALRRLRDE